MLGEGTELRRVFLILLDNAIKYTEAGSIDLDLKAEGEWIQVIVSDTGIGIEEGALAHIFDRFWRADKVRSRAEGGAGLGLSMAWQIVERHGGHLSVESQFGKGSTFTVNSSLQTLPVFLNPFQMVFRFILHSGSRSREVYR